MKRRARPGRLSCLALLLALAVPALAAEPPGPLAAPGLPASAFPPPSRPVAEIISPIWATERERDAVDEVGQVARAMGLKPGEAVADIGAGSGYYVVRLSTLVGPEGRVFGQDVVPAYLAPLALRVERLGLANVTLARGDPHDPRLPAGSLDAAVLVHMYHEIAQPFAFLHNLLPALRPGARIGIVDLDRATHLHGTPRALLRCELAAIGYRQVSFKPLTGDIGYLAVFEPPAAAERVAPADVKPCPLTGR